MTFDEIEIAVAKPPTTRDDAISLARDHITYCCDVVDDPVELPARLLNAPVWRFWWD